MAIIGISGKKQTGKDTVANIIQYLSDDQVDKEETKFSEWLDHSRSIRYIKKSPWEVHRWADGVKDCVCIMIGCSREQLEDGDFKMRPLGEEWWYWIMYKEKYPYREYYESDFKYKSIEIQNKLIKHNLVMPTPRDFLQLVGTEGGRYLLHPNIWVNSLMNKYKKTTRKFGEFHDGDSMMAKLYPLWLVPDTRFVNEAKAIKEAGGIVIRIESNRADLTDKHASETALDDYKDFDYVVKCDGDMNDLAELIKPIYYEYEEKIK